jgi:very-short-patch-repair endonuclease
MVRTTLALPDDPGATRSHAERRLLALIRKAGLPLPQPNAMVAGHLCDLVWHEHRLVAEYDSWLYHSTPERFANDRRRNNDVQTVRYGIFRFIQQDLDDHPEALIARLATELTKRSPGTDRALLRVIQT